MGKKRKRTNGKNVSKEVPGQADVESATLGDHYKTPETKELDSGIQGDDSKEKKEGAKFLEFDDEVDGPEEGNEESLILGNFAEDSEEEAAAEIDEDEQLQMNFVDRDISFDRDTTDLVILKQRIKDTLYVLNNFKHRQDKSILRHTYVMQLARDVATCYDYSFYLVRKFFTLFSFDEAIQLIEAFEKPRPLTIRANTLKTRRRTLAQALLNRGANVDVVGDWTREGLVVYDSQVPIGATPEYLVGHYMLQSAVSMVPVLTLAPREKEQVLDLCASPGGKSTHIAALMRNTGVVFSNDVNKNRLNSLKANIARLGVTNTIVTNLDGREYPKILKNFDRVLLDAPCTGLGTISRDPSIKTSKTRVDFQRCSTLQKELILAAIDSTRPAKGGKSDDGKEGGVIVYSTCTISIEENEAVVNYAISKRYVKVIPTGLEFGVEGFRKRRGKAFHPSLTNSRRFYPHVHNMDGFFVAKMVKYADGTKDTKEREQKEGQADSGRTKEEITVKKGTSERKKRKTK